MLAASPSVSLSRISSINSVEQPRNAEPAPASISSGLSSASSSKSSLNAADDENVTITPRLPPPTQEERRQSMDELRLLAVSTHITELSYSISDIQTRIFEIQELRHKSESTSKDASGAPNAIDQALMNLDERLEAITKGVATVNDALQPLLHPTTATTPTAAQKQPQYSESSEEGMLLRKHAALIAEWEAVQEESETLREELKEDKWLIVFRTVIEQADGMMSSLEKGINRCQDFMWQVNRRGPDLKLKKSSAELSPETASKDKVALTLEAFIDLQNSYEAKKRHYVPACTKVLAVMDKGVQERVTKNGETLRRHAEAAHRWKSLRDRLARTDMELENMKKLFTPQPTPSEASSSNSNFTSSTSKRKPTSSASLATPPNEGKSKSASASALSRSMSPFRRLAKKFSSSSSPRVQTPSRPAPSAPKPLAIKTPSSEPPSLLKKQRSSVFAPRESEPPTPSTPNHRYSQSVNVESPSRPTREEREQSRSRASSRNRWNSSTKVTQSTEHTGTIRATPPKRQSVMGFYGNNGNIPPVPPIATTYRRSLSRSSMASSRPWSPVTSSTSTAPTSNPNIPLPSTPPRPPSSAARLQTPTIRTRPRTPSNIPAPARRIPSSSQSEAGWSSPSRAISPTFSLSAQSAVTTPPQRPPSRSMIPLPSFRVSSASRSPSAMSNYSESPQSVAGSPRFRSSALRAQTPENLLRSRAQAIPFHIKSYFDSPSRLGRPSMSNAPPSSYRGTDSTTDSRPNSRLGGGEYVPANPNDPLDAEVARVVNSVAHGLLVERIDPPLKVIPKEGEIRAQYAFSNALSRKVINCRLTTMNRKAGTGTQTTHKVMCRVGGGWQDLQMYVLNRQAGM